MKYKISAPHPASRLVHVELTVQGIDSEEVLFQLPSWRPGRYELQNFARNIVGWRAINPQGETLPQRKLSKDCWKVNTEGANEIRVQYAYYAAQPDAGACWVDDDVFYINPVHCCLYVPEKISEECFVEFSLPENYHFGTALKKEGEQKFSAADYHELIDSPVLAGPHLQHHTYEAEKTNFHIWLYGESSPDWGKLVNDFRKFSLEQIKMMRTIPTFDYHFLVLTLPYKFYHGVEHAHSTVLALGPGTEIMGEVLYRDFVGVASHELFHVWNIKTIRPHEMLPYDYTRENYSRLGFVYEGVTTYYGDLFLARCGVYSVNEFLKEISDRVQKHFDNYGRFNLSVADSSYDTWLDGYTPGVPNRKVSIYDEGCLIALMTDLMIRRKTSNEKSLDDVMRTLYDDFGKKKIGYTEHDYISIIENLTNEGVADFFIDFVYGTEDYEPMLTNLLSHFGCDLVKSPSKKIHENMYGLCLDASSKVTRVAPGSPAYLAGLGKDDTVFAVNGVKAEHNLNELIEHFHGKEISLEVSTPMMRIKTIRLEAGGETYYPVYRIVKSENPTTSQQKFLSEWLKSAVRQTYSFMN